MRALRNKNEKKSAQKNLHINQVVYAEEKIKRKIYINRMSDYCGCSLLHLKASERFQSSLHSLTIIIQIVLICGFEIAVSANCNDLRFT